MQNSDEDRFALVSCRDLHRVVVPPWDRLTWPRWPGSSPPELHMEEPVGCPTEPFHYHAMVLVQPDWRPSGLTENLDLEKTGDLQPDLAGVRVLEHPQVDFTDLRRDEVRIRRLVCQLRRRDNCRYFRRNCAGRQGRHHSRSLSRKRGGRVGRALRLRWRVGRRRGVRRLSGLLLGNDGCLRRVGRFGRLRNRLSGWVLLSRAEPGTR